MINNLTYINVMLFYLQSLSKYRFTSELAQNLNLRSQLMP